MLQLPEGRPGYLGERGVTPGALLEFVGKEVYVQRHRAAYGLVKGTWIEGYHGVVVDVHPHPRRPIYRVILQTKSGTRYVAAHHILAMRRAIDGE